MNIGLVCYSYPPQAGTGGVATYMFRLAGALGKAGHQVHVVAGPSDEAPIPQINVSVHRVEAHFNLQIPKNRAMRWLYWHTAARAMSWAHPRIWHLIRWDMASEQEILKVDRQFGLELIEAPEFAGNAWMAGKIHRWPIVIRMHCPWELFVRINRMRFNPMNRVLGYLERKTLREYADCITCPSEAMKNYGETWSLRRPMRVIPNFMDIPAIPAPLPDEHGPQRIVCVGRIERLKGQDTLCKAFGMIAQKHPRSELWIVGTDCWSPRPFAEVLPSLVPDEKVRARIHFTGQANYREIEQHLKAASVMVVSSIGFESFSLSALEGMANARPIIVTRTGGLPELFEHERTGLITPAGSTYDMAANLDRMLKDRSFAQDCGLACHQDARERFDTRVVLPQTLEAYEEAANFYYNGSRRPIKIAMSGAA